MRKILPLAFLLIIPAALLPSAASAAPIAYEGSDVGSVAGIGNIGEWSKSDDPSPYFSAKAIIYHTSGSVATCKLTAAENTPFLIPHSSFLI